MSARAGSSKAGPGRHRKPEAVVPYQPTKVAPEDAPIDWWGVAALAFGTAALIMRVRLRLNAASPC